MTRTKPTDNIFRVRRGGSWDNSSATIVRAAFRYDCTPTFRLSNIGFRCAQRGSRQPMGKGTP